MLYSLYVHLLFGGIAKDTCAARGFLGPIGGAVDAVLSTSRTVGSALPLLGCWAGSTFLATRALGVPRGCPMGGRFKKNN